MGICLILLTILPQFGNAQALRIPQSTNFTCNAGRRVGVTNIQIKWNAPGVKDRESKIWGTNVACYGFQVLGLGSAVESPWRAGTDESTVISFALEWEHWKIPFTVVIDSKSTTLEYSKSQMTGALGSTLLHVTNFFWFGCWKRLYIALTLLSLGHE